MSIYTHPEELMKQWGAMAACDEGDGLTLYERCS
jgi:hypothetical protein